MLFNKKLNFLIQIMEIDNVSSTNICTPGKLYQIIIIIIIKIILFYF